MLTFLAIAAALVLLGSVALAAHLQIERQPTGRHRPGARTAPIDITGEIVMPKAQLALPAAPIKLTLKPGWQLDVSVPLPEVERSLTDATISSYTWLNCTTSSPQHYRTVGSLALA